MLSMIVWLRVSQNTEVYSISSYYGFSYSSFLFEGLAFDTGEALRVRTVEEMTLSTVGIIEAR
jgi:hypothetical protein